jgi:protoheme IX farnesyltransferase
MQEKAITINASTTYSFTHRLKDYSQLMKFRLSLSVVFSSAMGYLLASKSGGFVWMDFIYLCLGGLLIVGASNGINQIIERNYDKLMSRTENRPMATQRLSVLEASIFCLVLGVAGVLILGINLNKLTGFLGLLSLISYAFIYTPLKRVTSWSVHVGAFPGATSPMIGWVAYTGQIDAGAIILFIFQFVWQFPHFWSIAWILNDDYLKAGYNMLPSKGGRNKNSALQSLLFSIALLPICFAMYYFHYVGIYSTLIAVAVTLFFIYTAFMLYRNLGIKDAKRLMFTSFFYFPVIFIAFVIDKI